MLPKYSASRVISSIIPSDGVLNAFSVQVRFQTSDFGTTITTLAKGTVTVTSTITSQPQSLSTGAQAGIGVAVAIVVIGLLLLGACIFLRRRRRQPQQLPAEPWPPMEPSLFDDHQGLHSTPELPGENIKAAELPGQVDLRVPDAAVPSPDGDMRQSSEDVGVVPKL